ncbi:PAS domain S-box protein [Nibricoccus sp. IMCC34717]|uniref:PAS domain-containing sensor histidine kinase n=1 Tax=Nibricoccus sp. IMCC34717 TaxID=3034021 RepID=UPI00384CFE9A
MQLEGANKWLVDFGQLLPGILAVFDEQSLQTVFINSAGQTSLDPSNSSDLGTSHLKDFISVSDWDRFNREIFPLLVVRGFWQGSLTLRDMLGTSLPVYATFKAGRIPGRKTILFYAALDAAPRRTTVGDTAVSDEDMLYALLEITPSAVYFKDTSSRFLRISRYMADKFSLADPRDAIGKTDFDYFTSDHATPAFESEQLVMKTGEHIVNLEEKEVFPDGTIRWVSTTKLPFRNRGGALIGTFGMSHDITLEKMAEENLRLLSRAVEQSHSSIVITDTQGIIQYVNPYFEVATGYKSEEVIGKNPRLLKSGNQSPEFYVEMWRALTHEFEWGGEIQNRRKDGSLFWEQAFISAIRDAAGKITHYVAVKEDISEKKMVERERAEMQARLQLSSKLESVGSLAAGVAHEINTPTQFLSDNVRFLQEAFGQIMEVINGYKAAIQQMPDQTKIADELAGLESAKELSYLADEVPRCLAQSIDGLRRIAKIVGSLKEFSHPGGSDKVMADLNRTITTTVAVSRHEWKYVAEVESDLDPALPPVFCVVDEINQVFLNLIVNAAHAIEESLRVTGQSQGKIRIRTRHVGSDAVIEIEDTGTGIPQAIQHKIFDPFFTTKGVGKGTGQGLAIVQAIIVKKHGGHIHFRTEIGRGTTFIITLPIDGTAPTLAPSLATIAS